MEVKTPDELLKLLNAQVNQHIQARFKLPNIKQAGTSYDEIKRAHEKRVKEMERQFEEQKDGRRTLGTDEIERSNVDSETREDLLEPETKTEIEPEDVDVEELKEESSVENITEKTEDDNNESN